jgi:hypothetical protein
MGGEVYNLLWHETLKLRKEHAAWHKGQKAS